MDINHLKLQNFKYVKKCPQILEFLIQTARYLRGFKTRNYISKKIELINSFFRENNLDSVVLGLSTGIDSTVALYLYSLASKEENSPIKKIIGLSLPIINSFGSTNQDKLSVGINLLKKEFRNNSKVEIYHNETLGDVSKLITKNIDLFNNKFLNDNQRSWQTGQLDSILRTPVFYYVAAMLQNNGFKSIVSGTTNRDEGEYIGFYGKASDGMNDIQPIADLHKSEVYKLAKYFKIPEFFINQKPRGDVWNNSTDEELIGASYDLLETYIILKYDFKLWDVFYDKLNSVYKLACDKQINNIEKLHQTNLHKYRVGRPSHYIDVMKRNVDF